MADGTQCIVATSNGVAKGRGRASSRYSWEEQHETLTVTVVLAIKVIVLDWLIIPLLYSGYSIIRGAISGWYPYPFFNPAQSGSYGGVARYGLVILALFFCLCWLVMTLGNRVARAVSQTYPT